MREDGLEPAAWRPFRIHQVLPAGMDPAAATMVITWRETLSYTTRMGVSGGKSVLVVGSGGNGLSFVAHAANSGAAPVVMVGSVRRRGAALAAGATAFWDYRAADFGANVASWELLPKEAPQGFDMIIDAVGKASTLDGVMGLLRPGGTVGIYGVDDYGKCTVHPQSARGTFVFYNGGYDEEETHDRVMQMVLDGRLKADIWLDLAHPFRLEEIGAAIEAVRERKAVKALVRLSD